MRNIKIIFGLVIFSLTVLNAQEIQYEIMEDVIMYRSESGSDQARKYKLYKGEYVTFYNEIRKGSEKDIYRIYIENELNDIGWIDSEYLELIGSSIELPKEITDRKWVMSYYKDILKKPSREKFYEYVPFLRDNFEPQLNDMYIAYGEDPKYYFWWDVFNRDQLSRVTIRNNFISFYGMDDLGGDHVYAVKKRTKHDNQYILELTRNYTIKAKFGYATKIADNKNPTFILELDGDYLTIYLNDKSNVLVELIAVDDKFIKAVYDVSMEEKIDIDSITFPKRASE